MTTTVDNSNQTTQLQAPDFKNSLVNIISRTQAYRKGGIRLEHEQINGKHLFHNYGHGSSGISLAYGSAFISVKSVTTFVNTDHPIDCAVIGSGLISLLTAIQLSKNGYSVTLYAQRFPKFGQTNIDKKSASQIDQGLWLPFGYDMTDRTRHELLCQISYTYYKQCLKTKRYQSFKVATIYEKDATIQQLKQRIPGFLYNGYKNTTVSFGNGAPQNYIRFKTIKINTELFLEELRVQASIRGVKFVQQKFNTKEQVLSLPKELIFNCSGFSSKKIFDDNNMVGNMENLIIFKNVNNLNYTISANLRNNLHMRLHCFGDKVILRSETPVEQTGKQFVKTIIQQAQNFFKTKSLAPKL